MSRQPVTSDFKVEISEDAIVMHFWPTRSVFTFNRFTSAKDIANFGPISPAPIEQHVFRRGGTRGYGAAEVRSMAFRLATEAASRGASGPTAI
jgi:hypothetical protein